ncbi:MAG: hypothetical protein KKE73_08385 [Proteobacteria bacterium]|nr:hypothetical protein [Pseudomonadota bacterium]
MRIIIPAVLHPEEYLHGYPTLFQELTLRSARVAMAAARLTPQDISVHVVHDARPNAIALRLRESGAILTTIKADDSETTTMPFLPHGASLSLQSLAAPTAQDPVAILNPRNPVLGVHDLDEALEHFAKTDVPCLLSALPPADHPCQGKVLHALVAPFRPLGDGASLRLDKQDRQVVLLQNPAPARSLLVLMWQGGKIVLPHVPPRQGLQTTFVLPPGYILPDAARWGLITPVAAPGPARFLLPYSPDDAPWNWDHLTTMVTDTRGRRIAGRQDFPNLMQPDGSLCLFRTAIPAYSRKDPLVHGIWELPLERSLLITDRLAHLRWQLLKEHEQEVSQTSSPPRLNPR